MLSRNSRTAGSRCARFQCFYFNVVDLDFGFVRSVLRAVKRKRIKAILHTTGFIRNYFDKGGRPLGLFIIISDDMLSCCFL